MKKGIFFLICLFMLSNIALAAPDSGFADVKLEKGSVVYFGKQFGTLCLGAHFPTSVAIEAGSISGIELVNDKSVGKILKIVSADYTYEVAVHNIRAIIAKGSILVIEY